MEEAMKTVQKGDIGINQAAREYGVLRTTLKDRVSGRVKYSTKSGPQPYLSVDEETEHAKFVKHCAEVGYGKTRKDVMHITQSVANEKGILRKTQISHGWWARFIERQQDLSLRRGDSAAHDRMDAVNRETLKQYFDLLKDALTEHNLLQSPLQIYNVDESGIPLDPKAPNVVAKKGTKNEKGQILNVGKKGAGNRSGMCQCCRAGSTTNDNF